MTYSLKSLVFGIVALVGAFLVIFVFPDFDYNGIITIVASVAGLLGIANFREQFQKSVDLLKTKTMVGALLVAVPMVLFASVGFFEWNLPAFVAEGLKYFIEVGGGWLIIGAGHALNKTTVK